MPAHKRNQERHALSEMSVNKQLLPSALQLMGFHTDPNKIFQRKRQQSLTSSFIASPIVSLSKKRKIVDTDLQSMSSNKKLKIWNDLQDDEEHEENILSKASLSKFTDIKMVPEYNEAIFKYFYERESSLCPEFNYTMEKHSMYYLKSKLRSILVDWLVQVHEKFQCVTETLLLAINIMDRFLSRSKVSTSKLQLVAITCLFIAGKFSEINLPKLSNYAYVTDGAATTDDIKSAEYQILETLQFEIAWPNPMNFIRKMSKSDNYNESTRKYAKMLTEFAYCSPLFIGLNPSLISAIAMFTAKKFSDDCQDDKDLIQWIVPFLNKKDYHDLDDATLIINKFSSLLINEVVTPSTKIECLIQKFKNENSYADLFKACKTLKSKD